MTTIATAKNLWQKNRFALTVEQPQSLGLITNFVKEVKNLSPL